jgi:CheY-like chemotaxis protein
VLVVDDEAIVLSLMARTLLAAGYAVHQASNGADALALAERLPMPPDLVVTDYAWSQWEGRIGWAAVFTWPRLPIPLHQRLWNRRGVQ